MYEIKNVAQDLKSAVKRRWVLLIVSPILFVSAALVAIYFIEPKYESTTTILVQEDETLNPLVMYEMEVQNADNKGKIESLNEIIYSRSTMEMLIDSLNLDSKVKNRADKQELLTNTKESIDTELKASDALGISYRDTDPVRARNGAELLTNHFINTKLQMETRKHKETVEFFKNKLTELETIVEKQRNQAASITSDRMQNMPSNSEALQERLQSINGQLDTIEWQLVQEEDKLAAVESFQNESDINKGINHLYKLPLAEMQFGEELSVLLNEYDNLRQEFTESYPKLRGLAEKIKQVADRMPPTLKTNIERLKSQKQDLISQKKGIVEDMQQFFVASQRASSQQSDYSIYEGLYNDMKVKLEQAKITQDIGMQAADQFLVLDEAIVPEKPVFPNKVLIIGIGLVLGVIMGIVASAVAEVMDTTLRDESDMPLFDKPIIAYITNG